MVMDNMDNWRTPPEIFNKLNDEFHFDFDAAADETNHLCAKWGSDSLRISEWDGSRVFCNPPYGRQLAPFVWKCLEQSWRGRIVVALIPMRTRAEWWHSAVIGEAVEVRCVRKRPHFIHPNGGIPKYTMSVDSCIVVWDGIPHETRLVSWRF
jgi:phage N-6-adenine-methyltransferase